MLNRSFNGPERGSTVSSSVPLRQKHQHHPQQQQPPRGRTLGAVIKEKDEELALFLEMRKREKERQNSLLLNNNSDELDTLPDSKPGSSPIFKIVSSVPTRRTGADDFLNSDNNKNDYDWLLTPPGTPLFPSLDKETQRSPVGHIGTPKTRPTMLKSRLADPQEAPTRVGAVVSRHPISSLGAGAAGVGNRRPSSSGGLSLSSVSSRPATPTGRPVHPPAVTSSRPSRSSTPTSRASITSSTRPAAAAPPRSSTPAAARSSTPTSIRSSSAAAAAAAAAGAPSNPSSSRRSATPTATARRASGPPAAVVPNSNSNSSGAKSAPTPTRSSSVTRRSSAPATRSSVPSTRSSVPSPRGPSPTVRSRPWKPSEMPGFSLDAPPNLRTSMPERPSSASRGRPGGAPAARSASVEATARLTGAGAGGGGRGRRQSCSPSRGRAPNGVAAAPVRSGGTSIPAVTRSNASGGGGDGVSPVLIGSKMVERVVNLRRLAPPRRDEHGGSSKGCTGGKSSSSPDSSGFGRNLSKKSLDMAMRHMDIRRSIPNSLRPLMTNIPASSMYSVRSSGSTGRTRAVGVSDSPLATSSNASSELSVSNVRCLYGSEVDDDKETRSSSSSFPPRGGDTT
ncbi:unnamed protein product [Spirodela intermedia]|uniref:Uncharacterized protein n=1 Tax=Spirodela intermedia TaxID=51605 RepID=A0A7I8L974_SPIIN|nr:unnamed protein product [Spirodela intermedia]